MEEEKDLGLFNEDENATEAKLEVKVLTKR